MNRCLHRFLVPSALAAGLCCISAHAAELIVRVDGIRAQTGLLRVALVDGPQGWDGTAAPVKADGAPPRGDAATFVFKDLAPGTYAVMISHDENGNGKLDSNFIGMPTEGYGFSNNPKVMRKPTWEEARFELAADPTSIDVALR
jgi:uncharacterized protein (DUF2141 family)